MIYYSVSTSNSMAAPDLFIFLSVCSRQDKGARVSTVQSSGFSGDDCSGSVFIMRSCVHTIN